MNKKIKVRLISLTKDRYFNIIKEICYKARDGDGIIFGLKRITGLV